MYYPYFRGKQYELITIREAAGLMASMGFVPIIEPVREQTSGLKKTLDVLCDKGASAIVVVNPQIGEYKDDGSGLITLVQNEFADRNNLFLGRLLTERMQTDEVVQVCGASEDRQIALIHSGFSDARGLAPQLRDRANISTSVFLDDCCGKLYQRHFADHGTKMILVRDGFQPRRNRDHPDAAEFFSDLHATFRFENMDGFGDFLIVGKEYSEIGGPAYTIAIHLTYIDGEKDDEMHIRHFKSVRQDTPKDPAGKFSEALEKLIAAVDDNDSKFIESSAIQEFRDLHGRGHYPGLGHVKKLSMKHHIETLADYFRRQEASG